MANVSPDPATPVTALDPHVSALVIHDLKNRLADQGAMLAALSPQAPDLSGRIEVLRRHGEQLQRRLVAFLALYRLDADAAPAHPADAAPLRVIRAAAAHASRLRDGLTLSVDERRCPSSWVFDDYLVGLALEAALDNALRHARHDVVLGADREGDWLVLWVDDDGPGLDGGSSVDAGRASATGIGTGLGTALCRRVAERHVSAGRRGSVSLGPRSDGPGTRFALRLPA